MDSLKNTEDVDSPSLRLLPELIELIGRDEDDTVARQEINHLWRHIIHLVPFGEGTMNMGAPDDQGLFTLLLFFLELEGAVDLGMAPRHLLFTHQDLHPKRLLSIGDFHNSIH